VQHTRSTVGDAAAGLAGGMTIALILGLLAAFAVWVTGVAVSVPGIFTAGRLSSGAAAGFEFHLGLPGVAAFGIVGAVAAVLLRRRSGSGEHAA
jgi:hypothetical protein